jgi:putative transcriptional regulator
MDRRAFLTNQFLIAMPTLADPNFSHTVTYICEHNADGALGIVINRPLELTLKDVLAQLDLESPDAATNARQVFMGGPVLPERGFVLHEPHGAWDSSLKVTERISVTTSRDILAAMADGSGPTRSLVALGYAGWAAGQLEHELADNAWLSAPADTRIIFDTPHERRWLEAARLIGVDPRLMTGEAGHA